jgi:hypothetical protein
MKRGHAVALRLPYERRARFDPEKLQLILKVLAHVLTAVIVARLQARHDVCLVVAKDGPDALPQRLHRFEAHPRRGGQYSGSRCVRPEANAGSSSA